MTYLSIAPEGLREAFITGGLSPIGRPVDDIYGATYRRLIEAEPALLRALPGRPRAGPRHPPPARRRGRPPAVRRPTDRAPLPPAGPVARRQRRLRAAPPRHRAAVRLARPSCTTPRPASGSAATRSTRRSTSRPTPTAWRRAGRRDRLLPDEIEAEGLFTAEHVFPWMWEDYAGAAAASRRRRAPRGAPLAGPLRRRPAAPQRGPGRRHDLRQRPVRRARLRGGDGRDDPRPADLADRRVRAQRPARRRRARARPVDRPGARPGLTARSTRCCRLPSDARAARIGSSSSTRCCRLPRDARAARESGSSSSTPLLSSATRRQGRDGVTKPPQGVAARDSAPRQPIARLLPGCCRVAAAATDAPGLSAKAVSKRRRHEQCPRVTHRFSTAATRHH